MGRSRTQKNDTHSIITSFVEIFSVFITLTLVKLPSPVLKNKKDRRQYAVSFYFPDSTLVRILRFMSERSSN